LWEKSLRSFDPHYSLCPNYAKMEGPIHQECVTEASVYEEEI